MLRPVEGSEPSVTEMHPNPHEALRRLQDALNAAGIVIPSLGIAPGAPIHGIVLIELGRANPATIVALADRIERGTDR